MYLTIGLNATSNAEYDDFLHKESKTYVKVAWQKTKPCQQIFLRASLNG